MKFDDVVSGIATVFDLKRIASAHVVDYRNLSDKELREALIKVKPQYLDQNEISTALDKALHQQESLKRRVISQLFVVDVLLNEPGYTLGKREVGDKIIAFEQKIINASNEVDLLKLASGKRGSQRHKDLQLYDFVLRVAWEFEDTKSRDEANLLRKLRKRLKINEWDHRLLEAKLGKYPQAGNELHRHRGIDEVRRFLQTLGLVFTVRNEDGNDFDVIPEEIGDSIRLTLGIEIRPDNYKQLLRYKLVHKKNFLQNALANAALDYNPSENLEALMERVVRNIPPSSLLAPHPPRGPSNEALSKWCSELGLSTSGSKHDRIQRIVARYDSFQIRPPDQDKRAAWFEVYEALARRDYELLRKSGVISKDIQTESKFEDATTYLFETKLNHSPLRQPGVNKPDGLVSFKDMYLMWDCKSKESPGLVHLQDHLKQFDGYMEKSDKPVPVFLVIGPGFTEDSGIVALQYSAEHLNRNIVLITAKELKSLALEWKSERNKRRDEPFPLGLFKKPGRFDRRLLGKL